MQSTNSTGSMMGRGIAGFVVGAIFGLYIEFLLFGRQSEVDPKLLLVGPGFSALLFAFVSVYFSGGDGYGWFKIFSVSILICVAIGTFCGTKVYPPIMVAIRLQSGFDPVFCEKLHGVYVDVGMTFGIPIGAAVGVLVGLSIWLWNRRIATSAQGAK